MVIRKITIDNSVKYVPIIEKKTLNKTRQKIKKIQPISGGDKQNKKFSKNNKKFVKDLQQVVFLYLQNSICVSICYCLYK